MKCNFCNLETDNQFLHPYINEQNEKIYICEMDITILEEYDEETNKYYIVYDEKKYFA